MSGLDEQRDRAGELSAVDAVRGDLAEVDVLLERVGPPEHAGRVPKVDVWIAYGLRKRWRVVSIGHTYGEWNELISAEMFIGLLVDGNPDLQRLV